MYRAESAFFVRLETTPRSMYGMPWKHHFRADMAYRILGFFMPEVGSQPQALLTNTQGQSCFVALPHLRAVACVRGQWADSVPLHTLPRDDGVNLDDWVRLGRCCDLNQPQALGLGSRPRERQAMA